MDAVREAASPCRVVCTEADSPCQESVLFVFLALENFHGHVVDSAVVENHDSTIGSGLYMYTTVLAEVDRKSVV